MIKYLLAIWNFFLEVPVQAFHPVFKNWVVFLIDLKDIKNILTIICSRLGVCLFSLWCSQINKSFKF